MCIRDSCYCCLYVNRRARCNENTALRCLERWKTKLITRLFGFSSVLINNPSRTLSQSLVKAERTLAYSRALRVLRVSSLRYDWFIWLSTSSNNPRFNFLHTLKLQSSSVSLFHNKMKFLFFFQSCGSSDGTWRFIWWNHPFSCHRWSRNRKKSYSGQRTSHILWRVKVE